jgi:hypothetical protein
LQALLLLPVSCTPASRVLTFKSCLGPFIVCLWR